jgi:H/ACA ribonucleoprotein complex subunit 3
MARHLLQCEKCKKYTMKEQCACGGKALNPKPPKYSVDDRMGAYRRKAKEQQKK